MFLLGWIHSLLTFFFLVFTFAFCAIVLNSCPAPHSVRKAWHGQTLAMKPGVRMKGELSSWLSPALQHREEGLHVWFRSPTVQEVPGVHAKPQKKSVEA